MRAPDYSDELLIRDLAAAAAELGEPLTVSSYDAWQRGCAAASPALLIRRFGSWTQACERAGVATNTTRSTSRRWSEDDVVAIVATYLTASGSTGSFADYSAWARQQDNAPSGAVIRQRFQWSDVKKRAAALS